MSLTEFRDNQVLIFPNGQMVLRDEWIERREAAVKRENALHLTDAEKKKFQVAHPIAKKLLQSLQHWNPDSSNWWEMVIAASAKNSMTEKEIVWYSILEILITIEAHQKLTKE